MRISYSDDDDMAYIYLAELPPAAHNVARSVAVADDQLRGEIVLDFNHEGHLVGIEVFQARSQLPPEAF